MESRSIRSSRTLAVKFRLLQVSQTLVQKSQVGFSPLFLILVCLEVWGVMEHVGFVFRQRRTSRQECHTQRPPWSHPVCLCLLTCLTAVWICLVVFWPFDPFMQKAKCCWMTSSLGGGAHLPPSTSRPMGVAICRKWLFRQEKRGLSSAKEERPLNSCR